MDAAKTEANYSVDDLAYLLAPIALFPDPLVALILSASTFPVQVVEAHEWIKSNPRDVAARNFSQVDAKPWDSSIQALARFPEQIAMLAEHLDWTQSLGTAFAFQQQDVTNAIQMLRAKAQSAGNLNTTPQQKVEVRETAGVRTIYIAPTNPERIYVPAYDSSVVFDTFLPAALIFTTGVIVGSAWNSRWGWNNRNWNQVWITPPVWNPPPPNWRPGPNVRPPVAWRPGQPVCVPIDRTCGLIAPTCGPTGLTFAPTDQASVRQTAPARRFPNVRPSPAPTGLLCAQIALASGLSAPAPGPTAPTCSAPIQARVPARTLAPRAPSLNRRA